MAAPQWNAGPYRGQRPVPAQRSGPRVHFDEDNLGQLHRSQMPHPFSPLAPSRNQVFPRPPLDGRDVRNNARRRQSHYPTNSLARQHSYPTSLSRPQSLQHRPRRNIQIQTNTDSRDELGVSRHTPRHRRRLRLVTLPQDNQRQSNEHGNVRPQPIPISPTRSRTKVRPSNPLLRAIDPAQSSDKDGTNTQDESESEDSTEMSDISNVVNHGENHRTLDVGNDAKKSVKLKRIARGFEKSRSGHLIPVDVPIQDGERMRRMPLVYNTSASPSVTLVQHYNESGAFQFHSLDVQSESFTSLLCEVGNFPLHNSVDRSSQLFVEPFVDIFNRLHALRQYINEDNITNIDQDALLDEKVSCTRVVLDLLTTEFPILLNKFDLMRSTNPPPTIVFEDLWMVYQPGSLVFSQPEGHPPFALMIESTMYDAIDRLDGRTAKLGSPLTINAWYVDYHELKHQYDGMFGRHEYRIIVDPFKGERRISEMEFVPDAFFEHDEIRRKLKLAGQRFWQLSGPSFREITLSSRPGRHTMQPERIMVDPTTNRRVIADDRHLSLETVDGLSHRAIFGGQGSDEMSNRNSETAFSETSFRAPSDSNFNYHDAIDPASTPTHLMLLICTPWVRAFSFREKLWSDYPVAILEPVQFQQNAWSRLILNQEYKDVVQAMVNSHMRQSDQFEEFIPGKGGGVVILLHGPPGVGKTLTAESAAENSHKPLYTVTPGDLGTSPEQLEPKLSNIFKLAMKWDAILLLDEADVFLQDRDYENLTRNALVSIFLRTLDYFKGIMFLTSNRVGAFDQAFQSRIHITLGIPEFNEEVRKEVWKISITDLGRTRRDGSAPLLTTDECKALGCQALDSWGREPLDGRQIRNCVRSALALAQDKGERLSSKHLMTVIQLGNTFTKYLNRPHK